MKYIFGISIFLLTSIKVFSQETNKHLKWEIGVDLLPLIDKNILAEKSFFLRYHLKHKNLAWRVRFGNERNPINRYLPVVSSPPDPNLTLVPFSIDPDKTWYFRPGIEWQIPININSRFYMGSDIQLLTADNGYEYIIGDFSNWAKISTDYRVVKGSLIGFVGAKYHPKEWISLSIESSLDFSYQLLKEWVDETSMEGVKRSNNWTKQNRFIYDYYPILLINLGFHF